MQLEIDDKTTLAEAVESLYRRRGKLSSTDTVLGSDINRVIHLFYYLKAKKKKFDIEYLDRFYSGQVIRVDTYELVIKIPDFEEGGVRRCRLRFEAHKELYQFEVPILTIDPGEITVKMPTFIQSAQRRQYPRVRPEDLYIKFIIHWEPTLGAGGPDILSSSRYPFFIAELLRDDLNLNLINRIFTEHIFRISPNYEVKIYESGSQPTTLPERILAESQKTIFINDISRVENYYKPSPHPDLTNYRDEYSRQLKESREEDDIDEFFENMARSEREQFISSYIYSPLKVFQRIIGHVHLQTTLLEKNSLSVEQALRVDLLAKLMSYGLSKEFIANHYYKQAVTRVVDISLNGLLFEVSDPALFEFLKENTFLKIDVPLYQRTLRLSGEVTRCYKVAEKFNVGVKFLESESDDWKVLEEYVFALSQSEVTLVPIGEEL